MPEPLKNRYSAAFFQSLTRVITDIYPELNEKQFTCLIIDTVTIEALQKHSKTGRPLGDDLFITTMESSSDKTFRLQKPGRKRKAA